MSIGIGLDVRFMVDGQAFMGKIKVDVRPKDEVASFRWAISLEAPSLVARRIIAYIDTLGKEHIEVMKELKGAGRLYCLRSYVGGPTYMKDFYEKLGIALPSLKEGKEPGILEVIDFVYPPAVGAAAAAGAAAMEDPRVVALTLYERSEEVKRSLDQLIFSLYLAQANLAQADTQVPPVERVLRDELVQKIEEIRAEIIAQEALSNEIFRELSEHFPAIQIPPEGTPVAPIDPGAAPAVGGAHAMPAGRPGRGGGADQTFRE